MDVPAETLAGKAFQIELAEMQAQQGLQGNIQQKQLQKFWLGYFVHNYFTTCITLRNAINRSPHFSNDLRRIWSAYCSV
jgi:hypothetical protein